MCSHIFNKPELNIDSTTFLTKITAGAEFIQSKTPFMTDHSLIWTGWLLLSSSFYMVIPARALEIYCSVSVQPKLLLSTLLHYCSVRLNLILYYLSLSSYFTHTHTVTMLLCLIFYLHSEMKWCCFDTNFLLSLLLSVTFP